MCESSPLNIPAVPANMQDVSFLLAASANNAKSTPMLGYIKPLLQKRRQVAAVNDYQNISPAG